MKESFNFQTIELKDNAILVIKDLFFGINSSIGEIYNCSDEFNEEFRQTISKFYDYQYYDDNFFKMDKQQSRPLICDFPLIIFDDVSISYLESVSKICIENTSNSYILFLTKENRIRWLEILKKKDKVRGHFSGFLEE